MASFVHPYISQNLFAGWCPWHATVDTSQSLSIISDMLHNQMSDIPLEDEKTNVDGD